MNALASSSWWVGRRDRVRPQVEIVGCGFAGLAAARALAGKPVDVTVVNRANHHVFRPSLATIGRAAAVATMGRIRLWGFPAWLLWLFAHIYFLIGFRNRLVVMIDWVWAYWTSQRYARVIFGHHDR